MRRELTHFDDGVERSADAVAAEEVARLTRPGDAILSVAKAHLAVEGIGVLGRPRGRQVPAVGVVRAQDGGNGQRRGQEPLVPPARERFKGGRGGRARAAVDVVASAVVAAAATAR